MANVAFENCVFTFNNPFHIGLTKTKQTYHGTKVRILESLELFRVFGFDKSRRNFAISIFD